MGATMLYIREYPTQARVKELFDYVDGHLVWKFRHRSDFKTSQGYGVFKSQCVGKIARTGKVSGYWIVKINGLAYRAHRLIWIWNYGDLSIDQEIDHRDCNKLNYELDNLRLSERVQNNNNKGAQSNSKTGVKGVCWDASRSKWHAQIKLGNRVVRQRFDNFDEAVEFIRAIREKLHGEFHNHG